MAALSLLACIPNAKAHPHVWVTGRSEIIFDQAGLIKAVRNIWVFDEMYSAFATEGLGKNGKPPTPEELAPLAKTNIDSLAEFNDFTYAKQAGAKVAFGEPVDYALEARDDKLVVLRFTLPLKTPASASKFSRCKFTIRPISSLSVWTPKIRSPSSMRPKGVRQMSPAQIRCRRLKPKNYRKPFSAVCRRGRISVSSWPTGSLLLVPDMRLTERAPNNET